MSRRSPGTLAPAPNAGLFRNGEWLNFVKVYQRLGVPLNAMRRAARAHQFVWSAHQAAVAVSVPASTWTTIPMSAVDVDTAGLGVSGGGLLVPETGTYAIAAMGSFASSSTGNRRVVACCVNSVAGNIEGPRADEPPAGAGTVLLQTPLVAVPLVAGQTLTISQWQDSGAAINTGTAKGGRGALMVWRWA